jgi:hypothetical protein
VTIVPTHKTSGVRSFFAAYAAPWLGVWRYGTIMTGASFEGVALFWGLSPPRGNWLVLMSQTLDHCMRSPPFLHMIRYGLRVLNVLASLPFLGTKRRVSPWPTRTSAL